MSAFLIVVITYFFFVFYDLAVQFVDELIDGGIHVVVSGIGKDLVAAQKQRGFCMVAHFFDSENNMSINNVIEVPFQTFKFFVYKVSYCRSNVYMVTG